MHLPEVSGKLRLLVAAARHIGMRRYDLAPGLERAGRRRLDQRAARLALLATHLLVVGQPTQLHLHSADLVGLRCRRHGCQQPRHRVERAVGVVAREWLLVRPSVPDVNEFEHEVPVGPTQDGAEHRTPSLVHHGQQDCNVLQ